MNNTDVLVTSVAMAGLKGTSLERCSLRSYEDMTYGTFDPCSDSSVAVDTHPVLYLEVHVYMHAAGGISCKFELDVPESWYAHLHPATLNRHRAAVRLLGMASKVHVRMALRACPYHEEHLDPSNRIR